MSLGLTAVLMAGTSWAQQAKDANAPASVQESPLRQPPSPSDVNGKSIPAKPEKLVLADPDSKMYMRCRDPNDSKSTDGDSNSVKLNPKAAVLSEEAAKQHGFKASAHEVDCPKP